MNGPMNRLTDGLILSRLERLSERNADKYIDTREGRRHRRERQK